MILFINGSPKPKSNLRRMMEKIGKDTGLEHKIIDLKDLNIYACKGCVKCASTNRCVQKDDMAPLYDEIVNSDALVVGGVTYFAHPNALTRTFMERMYPLRHLRPQTLDKPGVAVAVGGEQVEETVQEIASHMEGYFNFNMVGNVSFKSATWPCYICGNGLECKYSGPALFYGEKWAETKEITSDMIKAFEDDASVVESCEKVSKAISAAVMENKKQ
ncbi:MAG: flavodoxin family protein [Deltaproteobacteria bacterium]|nr:flavodoxin family protein [Deltaproteobacteria bacterium]